MKEIDEVPNLRPHIRITDLMPWVTFTAVVASAVWHLSQFASKTDVEKVRDNVEMVERQVHAVDRSAAVTATSVGAIQQSLGEQKTDVHDIKNTVDDIKVTLGIRHGARR